MPRFPRCIKMQPGFGSEGLEHAVEDVSMYTAEKKWTEQSSCFWYNGQNAKNETFFVLNLVVGKSELQIQSKAM